MADNFLDWNSLSGAAPSGQLQPAAPSMPGGESLFRDSPFGPDWEKQDIVIAQRDDRPIVLQGGSPRLSWIYKIHAQTDGLELIKQYEANKLSDVVGSGFDSERDMDVYYERPDRDNVLSTLCLVRFNKALRKRVLERGTAWLVDAVWETNERSRSTAGYVAIKRSALQDAIALELGKEDDINKILAALAKKLAGELREIAGTIRKQKIKPEEWDPAKRTKAFEKFEAWVLEALDQLEERVGRTYLRLKRFEKFLPDEVLEVLASTLDAIQNMREGVRKAFATLRKGLDLALAYLSGVFNGVLDLVAGIADLIAVALDLDAPVERKKVLEGLEKLIADLRRNPDFLYEAIAEQWAAFTARYKLDTAGVYQMAYNAGEDTVIIAPLVAGLVRLIAALRTALKKVPELVKWLERAIKKNPVLAVEEAEQKLTDFLGSFENKRLRGRGTLGGIRLTKDELAKWSSFVKEVFDAELRFWETYPSLAKKYAGKYYGAFDGDKNIIWTFRREATEYVLLHEMYHAQERRLLGRELYMKGHLDFGGSLDTHLIRTYFREKYVFDRLMLHKERFSTKEIEHATKYIEELAIPLRGAGIQIP